MHAVDEVDDVAAPRDFECGVVRGGLDGGEGGG